jgi:hypothetical protein
MSNNISQLNEDIVSGKITIILYAINQHWLHKNQYLKILWYILYYNQIDNNRNDHVIPPIQFRCKTYINRTHSAVCTPKSKRKIKHDLQKRVYSGSLRVNSLIRWANQNCNFPWVTFLIDSKMYQNWFSPDSIGPLRLDYHLLHALPADHHWGTNRYVYARHNNIKRSETSQIRSYSHSKRTTKIGISSCASIFKTEDIHAYETWEYLCIQRRVEKKNFSWSANQHSLMVLYRLLLSQLFIRTSIMYSCKGLATIRNHK